MRVYIASVFADKDRVRARCIELNEAGIEITSRWANEEAPANSKATDKSFTYMRQTATMDLDDIMAADVLVLTSPTDAEMVNLTSHQLGRGGRHFESGFIYGLITSACRLYGGNARKRLVLMGRRENVFHFLDGTEEAKLYPPVVQLDTWEEVKEYLIRVSKES